MNVSFDYTNNPKLAELFRDWPVGERYKLVVDFQLDHKDEKGATGSIEEVYEMEGRSAPSEGGEGEEGTAKPSHEEPMMIVVAAGKRRKPMKNEMSEGMMEEPAYG